MNTWAEISARTHAEHARFLAALTNPQLAQETQLKAILDANRGSHLARELKLDRIRDVQDFQTHVPLHNYENLESFVHRAAANNTDALLDEPVILFEQTSGSTDSAKLIPYTNSTLRAFCRAIHPWLHDLSRHWPALGDGRAYFSISPGARASKQTASGIPIGAQSDAIYFGAELGPALSSLMAVPLSLSTVENFEDWQFLTLRYLLDADDLTLISVWSPTFMTELLNSMGCHQEELVEQIRTGEACGPNGTTLSTPLEPRPRRAEQVEQALSHDRARTEVLWPKLTLVSCWADGSAARFLPALRAALPGPAIQGKGLLATEGVISVPLAAYEHPVLALNSGFYEFIDSVGVPHLAHELELDATYQVVLTTYGGLYRYSLGDEVRVRGFAKYTPLLEFLGRGALVSDLCGEKISEPQVRESLDGSTGFALLAPSVSPEAGYCLIVDANEHDQCAAKQLAGKVERALCANPGYHHARQLGQLNPVSFERHHQACENYTRWLQSKGKRLGDIKPPLLHREFDWKPIFGNH